jgi:uroporphyrinogen-III decarboxylase
MLSPRIYERLIIPYSQVVTEAAHAYGLLVYSHICSPVEPFLTMGFYNRMGIDLFETLSPPPVGNVASLKEALGKLDPAICTRGNVGLDVLLNGTQEDVKRKVEDILRDSAGRKHIVAASDYLFYNTPEENVRAMADAVKEM